MNMPVGWAAVVLLLGCAGPSHVSETVTSLNDDFVGSTPCDPLSREFLKIPNNLACECIQWRLTLHPDDASGSRGTYALATVHGMSETNGSGFFQGGIGMESRGYWTTTVGSRINRQATVYHLQASAPHRSLSLIKADKNVLHILTDDGQLAIGNEQWSYTLNRIPKQP